MNLFRYRLISCSIAPLVLLGSALRATADDAAIVIDNVVVVLIDQNEVPAGELGMIAAINVSAGDEVQAGELLGKLDDRQALIEQETAETQLQIAIERATRDRSPELAGQRLAEAKQTAKEHSMLVEIAERNADNETRVLAAIKSQAVAKNELDRAIRAREQFVDSVSQSEIDGLQLTFEKTRLESQQAKFEQQNDRLQAMAEQAAAQKHQGRIQQAELEWEQATTDQQIRQREVELFRHQLRLAELKTSRHQLRAPFAGVVAEIVRHRGDWIQAGEPVIRLIRLDRLAAEGFINAGQMRAFRAAQRVELQVELETGESVRRSGEIVFVSSEIDPVSNEVKFRVEFDNPQRDVFPGMRLQVSVES